MSSSNMSSNDNNAPILTGIRFYMNADRQAMGIMRTTTSTAGYGVFVRPNGDKVHFCDGLAHREGGLPAIEYASGEVKYYLRGIFIDRS